MKTWWKVDTGGEPLTAIRRFLSDLWLHTELDGMILPISQAGIDLAPQLITNPYQMANSEPFAPFIASNSASAVARAAQEHPELRLAAVLRSCEAHTLVEMERINPLAIEHWVLIGVECLVNFPMEDFSWRLKKAGSVEHLTSEALRFSRHGGIAPYRFRKACQMCTQEMPDAVRLCIHLVGLPACSIVLISTRDEDAAEELFLSRISHGSAPTELVAQHAEARDRWLERNGRCLRRTMQGLNGEYPSDVGGMIEMLAGCEPCHKCLDACPLCDAEQIVREHIKANQQEKVIRWLGTCAQCGMCEQSCPKHWPLTAIHYRVRQGLTHGIMMT